MGARAAAARVRRRALATIDARLPYWPKWLVHKCKQRLTRLTQGGATDEEAGERRKERLGEKLVPRLAPKVRKAGGRTRAEGAGGGEGGASD